MSAGSDSREEEESFYTKRKSQLNVIFSVLGTPEEVKYALEKQLWWNLVQRRTSGYYLFFWFYSLFSFCICLCIYIFFFVLVLVFFIKKFILIYFNLIYFILFHSNSFILFYFAIYYFIIFPFILNGFMWFYMILYDFMWFCMILYDFIWFYNIYFLFIAVKLNHKFNWRICHFTITITKHLIKIYLYFVLNDWTKMLYSSKFDYCYFSAFLPPFYFFFQSPIIIQYS